METPATDEPARRLRCDGCGWVLEVTADELCQFSRGDWPRCCMRALILDVDDHSVRPTDRTKLERSTRGGRARAR